jgi:hypothetical protein
MKKLVFVFGALFAISLFSCTQEAQKDKKQDNDPIQIEEQDTALKVVTGIAIDGANNSISLLVGNDTVSFEYVDLDEDHKDSWYINDSVTVKYYVIQDRDSVIDVINEAEA